MADAHTARLCTQIVYSHFGPLTSRVVDVLLTRGRLSLPQIVRYAQLKPRTARACILVLIQHNILWHAVTPEDGEVLEVNVEECLTRLRFGMYVLQAEHLFGKEGADIVQAVLDNGKLLAPNIISRVTIYDPQSSKSYSKALLSLVSAHYLKASVVLSHQSPRDKLIKYEAEEKAKISGFPTAKELREARETAEARLKREEEEAEKVGLKRKQVSKKSRDRKVVEEEVIDDDVYFRVNYERFNIHIRNRIIESAVRERYNNGAALVMRATLQATEAKQFRLSDTSSDPTSLAVIVEHLPDGISSLSAGLVQPSGGRTSTMSLVKDYLGLLSAADNPTPAGRAGAFVSFGGTKVQVEFEIIARRLRQRVLEAYTRERYGDEGVRVLRLLLTMGKIDEKQVGKVAMMPAKDVRPLLSAMSSDNLISIQEVPKSADRNPSRTFYLWHVDQPKTYSVLLGNLYKIMYNIGMRRRSEQEDPIVHAVLEKRERTDVSEDESLLTRNEREVLAEWEAKRESLAVLEARVEEALFILRDFGAVLGKED